jgi:hypothetical protein
MMTKYVIGLGRANRQYISESRERVEKQKTIIVEPEQGRIQDFKLGGGALKKIAPSGGMRENFWGISCEKSRFYAKKSYLFPILGGTREIFGVIRVKNRVFTPKNHIFSNFRGAARRVRPPPVSTPAELIYIS